MSQRYITFVPHQDNVNETVSAEHVNELQDAVYELQAELQRQSDEDFLSGTLFILEHSTINNASVIDTLQTTERIDIAAATNVAHLDSIGSLALAAGFGASGTVKTYLITNPTGNLFKNLRLMANEYKPAGTNISYEISYDDVTFYPIVPGDESPIVVPEGTEMAQMVLRITFTSAADKGEIWELPRLDGFALLYQDDQYSFRYLEDGIDLDVDGSWDGTIIP